MCVGNTGTNNISNIKTYETFGVTNDHIDQVKIHIGQLLNVEFELHESDYLGMYYLARLPDSMNIKILQNFADGDWQEEDHMDCPLLIEINRSSSAIFEKLYSSSLPYLKHLYRTEIESKQYARKFKIQNGKLILLSEHKIKNPYNS
ncbi:hypothetical protein [Metabacillus sp. FJAT-52054]|uniref:Uncharacterized protein n=1 Tax=Metabacillus sediminis TaxID=3117746 RepID=A0ABZ2NJ47_9BACI